MNKEEIALQKYPVNIREEKSWNENAVTQFGNDLNLRSRKAFIAGYEAKEAANEWISVATMPDLYKRVLVLVQKFGNRFHSIEIATRDFDGMGDAQWFIGEESFYNNYNADNLSITHWMPLPNPPKQ